MQHKLFLSALIVCGTFYNFGPYAIANPSELDYFLQPKLGSSTKAVPSSFDSTPFISNMKWRSIGPYRGGRSIAVTGSKSRPNEYFFGATGGGVWKTTDGGKKWFPVSDGFFKTASVGAITVSEVNPDIVLAGTGERDIRGNISHGDGVYLSKDAGKTWTHLGLQETQNISKVIIHPKDPNVLFVAALGPVYGKSSDRGVYKSIDQGKSWKKILSGGVNTGTVDLTIDPNNPDVLLAANWEVFRTPYSLSSGGPGCGFFKSTDGGESWSELSRNKGLPQGLLGKIGFTISPVDSNRYWAQIEAEDGGLFMSDDAGQTWQKMNEDRNY
ncbi:MAG: WD40/YVTN/BNR-like repeat-containing protein, partial [Armatimonadota bacterium]